MKERVSYPYACYQELSSKFYQTQNQSTLDKSNNSLHGKFQSRNPAQCWTDPILLIDLFHQRYLISNSSCDAPDFCPNYPLPRCDGFEHSYNLLNCADFQIHLLSLNSTFPFVIQAHNPGSRKCSDTTIQCRSLRTR